MDYSLKIKIKGLHKICLTIRENVMLTTLMLISNLTCFSLSLDIVLVLRKYCYIFTLKIAYIYLLLKRIFDNSYRMG